MLLTKIANRSETAPRSCCVRFVQFFVWRLYTGFRPCNSQGCSVPIHSRIHNMCSARHIVHKCLACLKNLVVRAYEKYCCTSHHACLTCTPHNNCQQCSVYYYRSICDIQTTWKLCPLLTCTQQGAQRRVWAMASLRVLSRDQLDKRMCSYTASRCLPFLTCMYMTVWRDVEMSSSWARERDAAQLSGYNRS